MSLAVNVFHGKEHFSRGNYLLAGCLEMQYDEKHDDF
jgi:hypothetical protein